MAKNVIRLNRWTSTVHNSVAIDLREELKNIIRENPNWGWEQLNIQDVFGCAINQLPPIYTIHGENPEFTLEKNEIRNAIFIAMERVKKHPLVKRGV